MYSTMENNHDSNMVLDDEYVDTIYSNVQYVGAERISMKVIENLNEIWIPANLLQKRKNIANANSNKPAIFRMLEKRSEKSFSVYNENVLQAENVSSNRSLCPQNTSPKPKCPKGMDEKVNTSLDEIYDSDDDFFKENTCAESEKVPIAICDSHVTSSNISEAEASTCIAKGSEINHVDEPKDEALFNFPVAYKRPVIEETVKKQKNQKKKKNAQKKVVLDVFNENISENQYPEVDEFYESVVRKTLKSEQQYEHDYPSLKSEFKDSNKKKYQNFDKPEAASITLSASIGYRKPVNKSLEVSGVIIVLDNLPKYVSKEQVQDILPTGEVKSFYSSKCKQFKVAEIRMENDADAEWVIDCFNGDTPFGVGSPVLKCYKLS